ncbi:lysophosphatidic acid phosphatase type 6 [Ambystoma mexicanum]|uniref:lysophosphatidic acid phosphatase type 6 n=1 Tax=Ambystoma mexicanum TaxID=8296 RepID=UPI0037E720F8
MSIWTRVGLLGTMFYCMHRKRMVYADERRDGTEHRREGSSHRRDDAHHQRDDAPHRREGTHRRRDGACSSRDHELQLVQVMFRHGARTPLKPMPHKEQVEWSPSLLDAPDHTQFDYTVTNLTGGPQPLSTHEQRYRSVTLKGGSFAGQLTTVGMLQMCKLGERLRKTYVEDQKFLSPVFKPSEVFVRSTNIVRNVESTRCLLAGLFQQQQEGPVTIVTAESCDEILFPNYDGCKGLKLLTNNKMLNASSQPGMSEELKSLQQEIGIDRENNAGFFLIFDNLLAQEVHGLPGTLVLKKLLRRTERRVIDIVSYVMERNRELLQMSVGAFLHTVQQNMLDVVKCSKSTKKSRKLFLYAVHDVTLIPLLMALGIFDKKWPPYASDLTLELYRHKRSDEWYARLCYRGEEQVVRGCRSGLCPLEDFMKAISGYVLTADEYQTICSKPIKGEEQKH